MTLYHEQNLRSVGFNVTSISHGELVMAGKNIVRLCDKLQEIAWKLGGDKVRQFS
jgi:hypothetical protein